MSEAAPRSVERQLADIKSLQQELEQMISRVTRNRRQIRERAAVAEQPVLVISGK